MSMYSLMIAKPSRVRVAGVPASKFEIGVSAGWVVSTFCRVRLGENGLSNQLVAVFVVGP